MYADNQTILEQDPKSLVQTGPGLPGWHWRTVRLAWNGPVDAGQALALSLIGPKTTLVLCLARVALLLAALGLLVKPAAGGRCRSGPKRAQGRMVRPSRAEARKVRAGPGGKASVLLGAVFWRAFWPRWPLFRQRLPSPAQGAAGRVQGPADRSGRVPSPLRRGLGAFQSVWTPQACA